MSDPLEIIDPSEVDTIVIVQENNAEVGQVIPSSIDEYTILQDQSVNIQMGNIVPDNLIVNCCDDTQSSGGNGTGFVSQAEWLVIEKIAGESISALRMVKFSDADTVVLANSNTSYSNAKAIGIALSSASTGATVRVLIMGIIEDPFFTFPAETLLFLGVNGIITSTPPTSGYSVVIGEAPAVGVVSLSIREPIIL